MNIFLCGGLKSDWQDEVKDGVLSLRQDVEFFDPREHRMHDPKHYTRQDLEAIIECDIVIAKIEITEPAYANFTFQLGFAIALGKKVILINERGAHTAHSLHQVADVFGDIGGVLAALPFMKEFLQ
jgi:nucleoside 2-deoxyribosyltransferase